MSQYLSPVSGGVQKVVTTTAAQGPFLASKQYIRAKNLQPRPTEWVIGGRPIYDRLPSVGEVYRTFFFADGNIGYVYIPFGESWEGPDSLYVSASESNLDLILRGGKIVWKYGTNVVPPTLINIPILDLTQGRYLLAYEMVIDDAPRPEQYAVEDFFLTGLPFEITSSSDGVAGWRYPAGNAFLDTETLSWKNQDSFFPDFVQPTESWISWESELTAAYSMVTLRCPANTAHPSTTTAVLSYWDQNSWKEWADATISEDSSGQYFNIEIVQPGLQPKWRVDFVNKNTGLPYLPIDITSIKVSGIVTLMRKPSEPLVTSALAIYPENLVPKTVKNSAGEDVPAYHCRIALFDTNLKQEIVRIIDERLIVNRDFKPIADWLTRPYDENLIDLYEQVKGYAKLWMNPVDCMKQEYVELTEDLIVVS
jgi:hypothetical protein